MEDFIKYLLTPLVDDLKKITIKSQSADQTTEYIIEAPKSQMGFIIGKQGKLITSLRQLVRLKGIVQGQPSTLRLDELPD